ncbi:DUF3137 domain-containing protein [Aquimarina algiphila]|uniref:DUF3137 domain-containing protein n=1 Tax=Aquimarina algiphila TaxID=2047982 RepID=UPI0024930082|nr:DUF3137 domain-containing protein [Aquimarina algiphila]
MNVLELRKHLLEEHQRDKKLTVLGYVLILFTIIIIASLIYFFAAEIFVKTLEDFISNLTTSYSNYYQYILPLVFIGYLVFPIRKLYILNKRPALIAEFIAHLEEGCMAERIHQNTVYKIVIPLIKIKLNLCPVEFVNIGLVNKEGIKTNTLGYNFAVPYHVIPALKEIISSGNKAKDSKDWYELTETKTSKEPLKSVELFKQFMKSTLMPDIEKIEGERVKGKKNYILYFVIIGVFMAGWYGFQYLQATQTIKISTEVFIGAFIGVFAIYYLVIYFTKIRGKGKSIEADTNYQFKRKIFEPMIQFMNPDFRYILHGHITLKEFLDIGLFQEKQYDLKGNDQILGNHQGVPFQFCDLTVERTLSFSKENSSPDQVFKGQVFMAEFNKSFNQSVFLIPKKSWKSLGGNDIKDHLNFDLGEKVILEDPEFMKLYDVYAKDQIEARYILSTSLMLRIKQLSQDREGQYFISFKDDRITIANNNRINQFETKLFKSITKNDAIEGFYKELYDQLSFIEELKLSTNIWKVA